MLRPPPQVIASGATEDALAPTAAATAATTAAAASASAETVELYLMDRRTTSEQLP